MCDLKIRARHIHPVQVDADHISHAHHTLPIRADHVRQARRRPQPALLVGLLRAALHTLRSLHCHLHLVHSIRSVIWDRTHLLAQYPSVCLHCFASWQHHHMVLDCKTLVFTLSILYWVTSFVHKITFIKI